MTDARLTQALLIFALGAVLGYLTYQNEKNREAYMECLRVTEKLLHEDSKRISTPYCRL